MNQAGYQSELNLSNAHIMGNIPLQHLLGDFGVAQVVVPEGLPENAEIEPKDYAVTLNPSITEYITGMLIRVVFMETNGGGAVSINVNGLGKRKVHKLVNGNLEDLEIDELKTNDVAFLHFNGSEFQILFYGAPFQSTEQVLLVASENINPIINVQSQSKLLTIINQNEVHSRGLVISPADPMNLKLTNQMVVALPAPAYGEFGELVTTSEYGNPFTIRMDLKGRIVVSGSFKNDFDRLTINFTPYIANLPFGYSSVLT